MRRAYIVALLLTALAGTSTFAQTPMLRHCSTRDGLTSNVVYRIVQDRQGFLWFCTDFGACQFDGHEFLGFTSRQGLPDNEVFTLKEDGAHRLWVSCYNDKPCYIADRIVYNVNNSALCRVIDKYMPHDAYNTRADLRKPFFEGLLPNCINEAMAIPFCSYLNPEEVSFLCWRGSKEYFLNRSRMMMISGNKIKRIIPFKVRLVYYSGDDLFAYSYEKGSNINVLYKMRLVDDTAIVTEKINLPCRVYFFSRFEDSTILLATERGVIRYRNGTVDTNSFILGNIPVSGIHEDNEGNYWFSTLTDGVYMLPHSMPVKYPGKKNNNIESVCKMPSGALVTGYDNGEVDLLDTNGKITILLPSLTYRNRVLKLVAVHKDVLCAVCDDGFYFINLQRHTVDKCLKYAAKDMCARNDDCLLAYGGGAGRFDLRTKATTNLWIKRTTAIMRDPDNTIWLGTLSGVFTCKDGQFKKFGYDTLLSQSRITSLACAGNIVVIGTNQYGIYVWRNGLLLHLNEANGLSNNMCKKLFSDGNNNVWICTNKGIDKITFNNNGPGYQISHFTTLDGVPENGINDFFVGQGQIYIATTDGVVVLAANRNRYRVPVNTYITSILANNVAYNITQNLVLKYNQNNLQIKFTGISFSGGDNIQYKYVLQGTGHDTVYTSNNTMNLSAVNPGSYTLLIWARYEDGPWPELPAQLMFTILPPFWQTYWFAGAALLITGLAIYLLFKRRVKTIKIAAAEKTALYKRMTELEMQALRAQINPHFVFNALNSIQNYYNQNDELSANKYMTTFAHLIRQTFTHSRDQWLTLAEEKEMIQTYIELEQMRFKDIFTFRIDIAPEIDPETTRIPAMLIQPYVENAINHGLRHMERGGSLTISFTIKGNNLICIIEDNGVGFKRAAQLTIAAKKHRSMGMEITQKRIATINQLYSTSITVTVTDKTELADKKGTLIEIIIPSEKEHTYEGYKNINN